MAGAAEQLRALLGVGILRPGSSDGGAEDWEADFQRLLSEHPIFLDIARVQVREGTESGPPSGHPCLSRCPCSYPALPINSCPAYQFLPRVAHMKGGLAQGMFECCSSPASLQDMLSEARRLFGISSSAEIRDLAFNSPETLLRRVEGLARLADSPALPSPRRHLLIPSREPTAAVLVRRCEPSRWLGPSQVFDSGSGALQD